MLLKIYLNPFDQQVEVLITQHHNSLNSQHVNIWEVLAGVKRFFPSPPPTSIDTPESLKNNRVLFSSHHYNHMW